MWLERKGKVITSLSHVVGGCVYVVMITIIILFINIYIYMEIFWATATPPHAQNRVDAATISPKSCINAMLCAMIIIDLHSNIDKKGLPKTPFSFSLHHYSYLFMPTDEYSTVKLCQRRPWTSAMHTSARAQKRFCCWQISTDA